MRAIMVASVLVLAIALPTAWAQALSPEVTAKGKAAVEALEALQSVLSVGVNYADYQRRLGDTKIITDQFMRVAPEEALARKVINEAQEAYKQALWAWKWKIEQHESSIDVRAVFPMGDETIKRIFTCDAPELIVDRDLGKFINADALIQACWRKADKNTAQARRMLWH